MRVNVDHVFGKIPVGQFRDICESHLKSPPDFTVDVNRSVKPIYPDWLKRLKHPELERSGPTEYDLRKVVQWIHDDQRCGSVIGNTIYKHLQECDTLAKCLNLQDMLVIQEKGIAVFRELFAEKSVFFWGSVVQHRGGGFYVPYLCEFSGDVVAFWHWLGFDWHSDDHALMFLG